MGFTAMSALDHTVLPCLADIHDMNSKAFANSIWSPTLVSSMFLAIEVRSQALPSSSNEPDWSDGTEKGNKMGKMPPIL